MSGSSSIDTSSLEIARRLIVLAEQAKIRRKDPNADTKSLKEICEEDEMVRSQAETGSIENYVLSQANKLDANGIQLSDLIAKLHDLNNSQGSNATDVSVEVTAVEQIEIKTEMKITYHSAKPVEGLVKRSQNAAETDRYLLEFKDGATFNIIDKWSGRATSIWGDPHIDVDDQPGNLNGEFGDLKGSDTHTTMMLLDGTRVTFTARDNGIIETVDIFKGSQHLQGIGAASKSFVEGNSLFAGHVDSRSSASTPLGDVVQVGGDGNDWYSQSGQLLWGKTTGPIVRTRPAQVIEMQYRQEITQQSAAEIIVRQG